VEDSEKEFTSRHRIFRTAPTPISLEELRGMFDECFVQMMLDLEVGKVFVTDFRDIKRVK